MCLVKQLPGNSNVHSNNTTLDSSWSCLPVHIGVYCAWVGEELYIPVVKHSFCTSFYFLLNFYAERL